jgi:hypothetical protein
LPSCSTLNVPVHKSLSLLVCIFRCPVAFTDYCYSFCHASVNFLSFFMGPAGPLLQGVYISAIPSVWYFFCYMHNNVPRATSVFLLDFPAGRNVPGHKPTLQSADAPHGTRPICFYPGCKYYPGHPNLP